MKQRFSERPVRVILPPSGKRFTTAITKYGKLSDKQNTTKNLMLCKTTALNENFMPGMCYQPSSIHAHYTLWPILFNMCALCFTNT